MAMYELPNKHKGQELFAADINALSAGVQDALNRASDFNSMLPSVPAPRRWGGGRYVSDTGGFSLRSLTKSGDKWMAYFNPGRVVEIHAGGSRVVSPSIGGKRMDYDPYPSLEAKKGKVYLDLTWGSDSHDCITGAVISAQETPPGGRNVRMVLGEFVAASGGSGSSIDDVAYKSYLTGVITYASASFGEGWRVMVVPGKTGTPQEVYVRRGDIYVEGKLTMESSPMWMSAPLVGYGSIYLSVVLTKSGGVKEYKLVTARGEEQPVRVDDDKDDPKGKDAQYFFRLARVQYAAEPFTGLGNAAAMITVRQCAMGAVYCTLARGKDKEDEVADGNEGFRVRVVKGEGGAATKVQVRPGHVYFRGRFCTTALEGDAEGWVTHAATGGEVWLVVQFDVWGRFESATLAGEQPSLATLQPFILSPVAAGIRGQYAFHLATVESDGLVRQYALGAVYCEFDPATFFAPGPAE